MANSVKYLLVCLLATTFLANALKIKIGNMCLSFKGSVSYKNGSVVLNPTKNALAVVSQCIPGSNIPGQSSWEKMSLPNGNFQLCIQTTNMCLTLSSIATVKWTNEFIGVIMEKNTPEGYQQWKYDGKSLTNVFTGPNFCAQAERDNLRMLVCVPGEPKQKIEIV